MPEIYKKLFISAGESSGDIHGANLMDQIQKRNPQVEFYGLGKENMKKTGLLSIYDMSKSSVMWLHVLKELSVFLKMKRACVRFFTEEKPCAVILIDYCGFNFQLARAAKKCGIPVIYYISPQIWAHGPWRVKKMKKLVDKVIAIYPFEKHFYERAGIPAVYVGHPLFDEIGKAGLKENLVSELKEQGGEDIISLIPGSRQQEIVRVLPLLLQAAPIIKQAVPSSQFLISCSNEQNFGLIEKITAGSGVSCKIITGNIHEIIKASRLCIAGAGTVTLQIAYYHKPMIIVYRISPFAYFIASPFLITPYIGLVNKLANKMIVPELLIYRKNYKWIANEAVQLLTDSRKRHTCIQELSALMEAIGKPGASAHAADEVLKELHLIEPPIRKS
ncbi:MAG: lipid-A-disaccharide synthase [Candidatus Loosdrechtia sp.]|uniref:lipid-A-disaccharide synthase n=1 Tax=Candidatus Loosdrechtia sp. TaxID=3101272 RepID=UPI003A77F8DD|nr:MAG: lipid-A-disaccharide synthase [Candidatus Jettenia sp. AMX2]